MAETLEKFPFLEKPQARRMCRAYGSETKLLLDGAGSAEDLGMDFGAGLSELEVNYMRNKEWARTAEDVLWRRSKLGLKLSDEQIHVLEKMDGSGICLNISPIFVSSNCDCLVIYPAVDQRDTGCHCNRGIGR